MMTAAIDVNENHEEETKYDASTRRKKKIKEFVLREIFFTEN